MTAPLTRRGALAAGGAAVLGAAGGLALGRALQPDQTAPPAPSAAGTTPQPAPIAFHGPHQAGVTTAPPAHQTFVGLDLLRARRSDAEAITRLVTDDAARLMAGEPTLADPEPWLAGPGVSVTFGLGRQVLERLGLRRRVPAELAPLPAFSTDALEPPWSQTDFVLQVGADDPLTLAHAVRVLTVSLSTLTRTRWSQPGFRGPFVGSGRSTRNLMGQVDGTVNPTTAELADAVWLPDGPQWYARGTVLVLRRIRMHLDEWSEVDPTAQERIIGRRLADGAALGASAEHDPVPFDAVDDLGLPVIDPGAHIRVAHAATAREMILRRPYSYDLGPQPGGTDSGLIFAAYTRDPRASFIPMQHRVARSDAFNRWNTTIGSAAYLLPGGVDQAGVLAASAFT